MRLVKRFIFICCGLILLGFISFFVGPKMNFQDFDNRPLEGTYSIEEVANLVRERNKNPLIKEGNSEEIKWSFYNEKTEYSIVYLHGFSASHEEGAPIHEKIGKFLHANVYLSRLPMHGLNDSLAFEHLTPKALVDYAKEAVKIGKSIGNKVIVMSCSTGGTLSAYLAAADPEIDALVMFSPNFELHDSNSKLLTKPWGLQMARMIKGGDYHTWAAPEKARPFWYWKYRLEGLVALQALIDKTMTEETFKSIRQPVFVGYFYENEENKDFTVSIDKIREVETLISTPKENMNFKAYPDGSAHVLISPLYNDDWQKIQTDVELFLMKTFNYSDELTEEMMLEQVKN